MGRGKKRASPPRPARAVLIGVVGFYVAVLIAMVAADRYVFLMKSLVVPVLVLAALLIGRFKGFVNEWAVFLGAVIFFDFGRGLAFALTSHFELPMYLDYVLRLERWLCGGAIAPVAAQQLRAQLSDPIRWDRFFVLIYSSHFLFFLVFGFAVWQLRREMFRPYVLAVLAVMYGGLLCYFFVPTIPPWAAASEFAVIPPIEQIVRAFYTLRLPWLWAAFEVNPIAAMPSLHAALPAICALLALRIFGRWGLPVVLYTSVVWVAIIYLGEHFLVDVLAGGLLAALVYATVRWSGGFAPAAPKGREWSHHWQVRPIGAALILVGAAVGFGQLTVRWMGPLPVTRTFVERELIGRSPAAHYLLGRIAFEEGNFRVAQSELAQALHELPHPDQQKVIRHYLAMSALQNGDSGAAIRAFEPGRATK